jgi:hypothetical protein
MKKGSALAAALAGSMSVSGFFFPLMYERIQPGIWPEGVPRAWVVETEIETPYSAVL